MRILLDENVDERLVELFAGHEVVHIESLGLKSMQNGELISFAREHFDVLITRDRGMAHQHDHRGSPLIIVVMRLPNALRATQESMVPQVLEALAAAQPGTVCELSL